MQDCGRISYSLKGKFTLRPSSHTLRFLYPRERVRLLKKKTTAYCLHPVYLGLMEDCGLGFAVRCGNYSTAVKLIDPVLQQARRDGSACVSLLLCNRAYCYHQLGLLRKAMKARRPNLAHGCTALALFYNVCCLQVSTLEHLANKAYVGH